MPQTKEEVSAKKKIYYQKNKEKFKEKATIHYEKNKEKINNYRRTHPNGVKSRFINDWKKAGLVCSDYDLLYSNYLAETYCDFCRVKFTKKGDGTGTFKCMDHSHETGLFRNFLCNPCNLKRGE